MELTDLIQEINDAFRGGEEAPTSGDDEWLYWTRVANRKKNEFARDIKQKWSSTWIEEDPLEIGTVATTGTTTLTGTGTYFLDYQVGDKVIVSGETVRTIATITSNTVLTVTVAFSNTASAKTFTRKIIIKAGTQSYNLNRRLIKPSDVVYATTTESTPQDIEFIATPPQDRRIMRQEVFIFGDNPKTIKFEDDVDDMNSTIIGASLYVPGYHLPPDLSADTDLVSVDDPNWLVYAVASEIAFNDVTYDDKSTDLNNKANSIYVQMIQTNRTGTARNPRISKIVQKRIGMNRFGSTTGTE